MADDTQESQLTQETPAQRLIRERREKELQSEDNQHSDAGEPQGFAGSRDADQPRVTNNKEITSPQEGVSQDEEAQVDKTRLTKEQEKHLTIDGEPRQGHAPLPRMNNVITGRHVGREENPSDVLKEDGSKSPHDASSGGSRQAEGIRQAKEAQRLAEEAAAAEQDRANQAGVVQTPTPEQRASGQVAESEGRTE